MQDTSSWKWKSVSIQIGASLSFSSVYGRWMDGDGKASLSEMPFFT
jgi:hypothetical protein